jgi:alpha-ribazole phosphatase
LIDPGICYGRLDIPLHPEAAIGDIAAHPLLAGASRVWTSPAQRCRVLAEAIAAALSVPLIVDDRLQELNFGAWEGIAWDAVPRAELDRWADSVLTFAPPGGESGVALIERVRSFDAELRHVGEDCVVVSHGGPLKVLGALLSGRPVDLLAPAPALGSVEHVECRARGVPG